MRGEHPDPAGTGAATAEGAPGAGAGRDRVTEEFRLLLDAAAWRAEEYLRGAGGAEHAEHAADDADGTGQGSDRRRSESASSCGWCPICAVVALLRGERPEPTSRLTEQLAGLVELLRESLAEHGRAPAEPAPPTAPGDSGDAEPPAPKVQRIDVRRVRGRAAAHVPAAGRTAATGESEC
ncbi:hypothetical protein [Saccharopolyspora gloriosae]|uniref:Pyruvate/2-oxoglutarate dehydrogenase complex dihydrolipoamide acyltransferase (E2) component n=1 Tax=Saccharopolyspora gloriosae TaxID=455344 RepID=A0A840NCU8_9PSEU|nr:hypothetical protein [Saccharopolyspora gloriosae]MBB5068163.1 pyruvate/2-oxoglutarate dehydrogenase complex dihydrolipoamide acyltransferase (E2) component [Saccharopolyspora gloriosae]